MKKIATLFIMIIIFVFFSCMTLSFNVYDEYVKTYVTKAGVTAISSNEDYSEMKMYLLFVEKIYETPLVYEFTISEASDEFIMVVLSGKYKVNVKLTVDTLKGEIKVFYPIFWRTILKKQSCNIYISSDRDQTSDVTTHEGDYAFIM